MAQISVKIDDDLYNWLQRRVRAPLPTISSQVIEALQQYKANIDREVPVA